MITSETTPLSIPTTSATGPTFEGAFPLDGRFTGGGVHGTERESGAWAAGLRAGVLITPTLLSYVDGGWTGAHFDQVDLHFNTLAAPLTGSALPSNDYSGWFIGGGTEYAVTWLPIPGIFWRNEYRYSSYSGDNLIGIFTATGSPNSFNEHSQINVQTIVSEIVWRFNWPSALSVRD